MLRITAAAYVAMFVCSLDFKTTSSRVDIERRYLIIEAIIQPACILPFDKDRAPNRTANQPPFLQH